MPQTRSFNDKELWPEDGTQPFVWSTNDKLVSSPPPFSGTKSGKGSKNDCVGMDIRSMGTTSSVGKEILSNVLWMPVAMAPSVVN